MCQVLAQKPRLTYECKIGEHVGFLNVFLMFLSGFIRKLIQNGLNYRSKLFNNPPEAFDHHGDL